MACFKSTQVITHKCTLYTGKKLHVTLTAVVFLDVHVQSVATCAGTELSVPVTTILMVTCVSMRIKCRCY